MKKRGKRKRRQRGKDASDREGTRERENKKMSERGIREGEIEARKEGGRDGGVGQQTHIYT